MVMKIYSCTKCTFFGRPLRRWYFGRTSLQFCPALELHLINWRATEYSLMEILIDTTCALLQSKTTWFLQWGDRQISSLKAPIGVSRWDKMMQAKQTYPDNKTVIWDNQQNTLPLTFLGQCVDSIRQECNVFFVYWIVIILYRCCTTCNDQRSFTIWR